ncbi:MAG: DMT family transporter [Pseudomonadota bacterium]
MPTSAAPHWPYHLKLIGMAVLWGASWPCGRILAQSLPPLTAASLRFVIAAVLLMAWLRSSGRTAGLQALSRRQWGWLAIGGAVGVFGYAMFFMLGLQRVPASRAALVVTTNPALTMLIAAWWFKERMNGTIMAGMVLAALGAAVVITHGAPQRLFTGELGTGEALLAGCVLSWVGYTLIGRGPLAGIDALTTTTVTAAIGCAMLLAAALAFEGPSGFAALAQAPAEVWSALLFLAVGATVLAYSWYFDGVGALGAGAASGYITLVPVFGVALSALLLGEQIDASIVLGGAMAIGGMAAMHVGRSAAGANVGTLLFKWVRR